MLIRGQNLPTMVTLSSVLFLEYSGLILHESEDQTSASWDENNRNSLCKLGGVDGQVRLRAESCRSCLNGGKPRTLWL